MTRRQRRQELAGRDAGAGYNARERLAALEALAALQNRLLQQAARSFEAYDRRLAALEQRPTSPHEPDPVRYVPIAAAAKSSGLSVRTMKRLVASGAVAGCAVAVTGSKRRRWLVDAGSLESYLSTTARSEPKP